ncbi:high mobility group box, partial [Fomitiporia mediterranea MF3/22]|uniref:high mobility group box n=1 Tax=Fomitiporia mediterranea (strain MF3/22) TaxID=694068 RepID=UPI0004407E22
PAHIPRPPNAFILFRSSFIRSQHVSAETEGNHGTLSKIVGMLWHNLSYEERQVWQAKARRAYAEHKRMYPGYSFRPVKDK